MWSISVYFCKAVNALSVPAQHDFNDDIQVRAAPSGVSQDLRAWLGYTYRSMCIEMTSVCRT